jgi:peptidoglycan/LPS O-acetylase OafA/YrhL
VTFLKRRFSRIYPLHFLITIGYGAAFLVAAALGITVHHAENFSWSALLVNLLLLRGLGLIGHLTFNGPAWYVSSQWQLYLMFPVLALCVLRITLGRIGSLLAAVGTFLCFYYLIPGDQLLTQRTSDYGILRAVAEFPIGLALYRVFQGYECSGSMYFRPVHVATVAVIAFFAGQFDLADSVIALLLATLIFVTATAELHHSMKWLTHPWLIYGGEISYAIYLIHMPFLACARKAFPLLGALDGTLGEGILIGVCAVLVLPLAAAAHRWIERPAARWTWKMLNRSAAKRAVATTCSC